MYYQSPGESSGWSKPYIFAAGLLVGVALGWIFQDIIGTLLRLAMVALVVIAVLYGINIWRRSQRSDDGFQDVAEADWRDLNSRRRK